MSRQEVYISSTLGPIPLSFTGRHLMQSLRECIHEAIQAKDFNVNDKALSRIRGKIAQRMSELERQNALTEISDFQLLEELSRRLGAKSE